MKKQALVLLALILSSPAVYAAETDGARLFSILEKSNRFYGSVQNYSAIFEKQERSSGKLGEKERIFLKFEKPFKIFMGWLNTEKKDLQVVYQRGHHNGKLAIHKPGLALGLLPVVFLDQDSPWVRVGSQKYDIEDAGIGTFLTDFTKAVNKARDANQLKVIFLKPEPSGGEAAEVTFTGSTESSGYFAYRILVSFDPATSLPVHMSLFDWKNELIGEYTYQNVRINAGPDDNEFVKQINRQLYRVYREK